jgi:hypothetical protein
VNTVGKPTCWLVWKLISQSRYRSGEQLENVVAPPHLGGTAMDPDNDPQIEYWQWHADSFQWVIGSVASVFDSIPT